MKVIINVDPETGEADNFVWIEEEEPPLMVRSKVKRKTQKDNDKKIEKNENMN